MEARSDRRNPRGNLRTRVWRGRRFGPVTLDAFSALCRDHGRVRLHHQRGEHRDRRQDSAFGNCRGHDLRRRRQLSPRARDGHCRSTYRGGQPGVRGHYRRQRVRSDVPGRCRHVLRRLDLRSHERTGPHHRSDRYADDRRSPSRNDPSTEGGARQHRV